MTRILILVGSLRAGSTNRQLAEAAVKLAPDGVEVVPFDALADIPFYNEDIDVEGSVPAAAAGLREAARSCDAFLLFCPEHNGTVPAVLKNAIDWLSRPRGAGAFGGKPVAVVGATFGRYGGVWAQDAARKAASIAGGKVIEGLKLSVPGSLTRFAETHPADDTELAAQLTEIIAGLHSHVDEAAGATQLLSDAARRH
ncbi:NAD(P)H-dependent oxidoreductase [Streptomyces griseorubiginosus]|uniref:NAD(P)H-dependent oxidoreductase n=1 Tax=Streptomyces griseorubiginosus TaxID=67304 RepID=UPI00367F1F9D